jgi:hypothetical protein
MLEIKILWNYLNNSNKIINKKKSKPKIKVFGECKKKNFFYQNFNFYYFLILEANKSYLMIK